MLEDPGPGFGKFGGFRATSREADWSVHWQGVDGGGCCTVAVDRPCVCACVRVCVKAVGLQRSGLDSSFPLRSLLWREKKTGGKKRKEGRREGMTREEGHLVVICVCKLAVTVNLLDFLQLWLM